MNTGDTVRVKRDNPNEAEIRAGECGMILAVKEHDEQTVYTVKVGAKVWQILAEDCEPVDVVADFGALMATLDLDALMPLADFYDADDPIMDRVPVEPGLNIPSPIIVPQGITSGEGTVLDCDCDETEVCEVCGEVVEEHEDCPDGPHIHEDDGTAVELPFLGLTDADNDRLLAVNITQASAESSEPERVLSIRLMRRDGGIVEVHLTEGQALMLGTFLFRQYGPKRD